jgi:hypothetical protein
MKPQGVLAGSEKSDETRLHPMGLELGCGVRGVIDETRRSRRRDNERKGRLMDRIKLTDGSGRWFNADAAQAWEESTYWDGHNYISHATGSQWEHERMYKTKGGVYVLHSWSQWQGTGPGSYEQISADDAARWLSKHCDGAEARAAGVGEQFAALEVQ